MSGENIRIKDYIENNDEAHTIFTQGLLAVKDRRAYIEAVDMFTQVIALEPDFPFSYRERGDCYNQLGKFAEAFMDYTKAMEKGLMDSEMIYKRSVISFDRGEIEEGVKDLEKVLKLEPNYAPALVDLGNVRFQEGVYAVAADCFDRAIAMGIDDYLMYIRRGIMFMTDEDFDRAIDLFERAQAVNPLDFALYLFRGNCHYIKGELKDAALNYEKGIFLNPSVPEFYYKLGCVMYDLNNFESAVKYFGNVVDLLPDSETSYFSRGLAYLGQEDFPAAIADFEKSISIYDQDANVYYLLSQAYLGKGDAEAGEKAYRKALELGYVSEGGN